VATVPTVPTVAERPAIRVPAALQARLGASKGLADWPRTTRLLPWSIAGFLAMIFLFPFDSTDLPISLPLDATLDRPVLGIVIAIWLISASSLVGVRRLSMGPVHYAFGIFIAIAVLSVLFNFQTLFALHQLSVPIKKIALLLSYALLFTVACSSLRVTEVRRLITFMIVLATITAIGVIVEYRTGFNAFYSWGEKILPGVTPPADLGTYDSIGRKTIVGPTIHPLAVAMMLALVLPFAVMALMRTEDRRAKVFYAVAAALMIGGAAATQRKTAFVVPVICIAALFAYRPRMLIKRAPLGAVLAVAIAVAAPGALAGVVDQLRPGQVTGVATTQDRVTDYDAIRPDVVQHPFLGRGYDSYDQKRYRILDNQYLTLVVNVGFVGILGYLGIMLSAFLLAHRCARSYDPDRAWFGPAAAASFVGFTIGSGLLDVLSLPQLPYLFCFLAAFATIHAKGLPSARTEWRETLVEHGD
jgi:O-antigen ligase/polysaccharide polymerase Wzy-like membrane protein